MKILLSISLISIILLVSCVETPVNPIQKELPKTDSAVFILCEGLMGYNNSSITRYDLINQASDLLFYENNNNGLKLGDTANDIVLKGDTAFVSVLGSNSIEIFNIRTGKFLNRIIFAGSRAPRIIVIANDSLAFVSDLYNNSVTAFNPSNFAIIKDNIAVGPQPEGIDICGNYLIVCNSAYGDFNSTHPDAETISIVDINTMSEIKKIKSGANTIEVKYNKRNNKIYVSYYNLPSRADSIGGIIEYSAIDFKQTNHWKTNARKLTLSSTGDTLFYINQTRAGIESKGWKGVSIIDLKNNYKITNLIENSEKNDIWYALNLSSDGNLWIGNAKNHYVNGEILIYSLANTSIPIKIVPTSLNPNKIVFF